LDRRTRISRLIALLVMLILLTVLVGCSSDPTATPIGPLPVPSISPLAAFTPFSLARFGPLRSNSLVKSRVADFTPQFDSVVDGTYCTPAWHDSSFPSSVSLPVDPVNGDLLLEWNSSGTSDYIALPNAPTYGLPAAYTIATSDDSTDGTNGSWHNVITVTGNTARTREHRFPFAGARWVRMTVTDPVPGPLGDSFSIDEIDLHDATSGTDDSVFFLGDSITAAAFTRCPADQPSFANLVHQAAPTRFPAMIDGGVGGVNSGYGVSVVQDWLSLNPDFHIWAIGYGTNDAWQKVAPGLFEQQMQNIVDRIQAAGRIPVLARIPFASKGPADSDVRALNAVIDRVTARNGLIPGPDLYDWFSAHPQELSPDGVHPSDVGDQSINRLWYEALTPLYLANP
jgi:acyl-CoA thioesterase-1